LMPEETQEYQRATNLLGVALVATEKIVQITYETLRRPEESQYAPWLTRLLEQLDAALTQLDHAVCDADPWLFGDDQMQADITIAVMWRVSQFIVPDYVDAARFGNLVGFSERAEKLPEYMSCPLST
jgi:glutathione S-transferase